MKHFGIFAICAACFAFPAVANQPAELTLWDASYYESIGAAERIESGEYLRTYSQEVAAAACFYHNGIDTVRSVELLQEARAGFYLHLDALENGNADLGIIGHEERRKTIAKLDEIKTTWMKVDDAIAQLLADHSNKKAVAHIKDTDARLLRMTDLLVTSLQAEYANPVELLQVDVLMLEVAGRQSLMTQKIAKYACKLASGRDTETIRENLADAMSIYEVSLNALLNGMPEVGLRPAPTKEIASALQAVQEDWSVTRPVVQSVIDGTYDTNALKFLFQHMADEMHKLEEITHLYVDFSKHQY